VAICNITFYAYNDAWKLDSEDGLSKILEGFERYFLSAKAWTLLSILFGFGFGMLLDKKNNEEQGAVFYFVKRMFILLLFAIINTLFNNGDILRDYAILGLFLLLFYKLSARTLFIISLSLFVLLPFFSCYIGTLDTTFLDTQLKAASTLKYSYNVWEIFKYNYLVNFYQEVISPFYLYTVHYVMFLCMLLGLAAQKIRFFDALEGHRKTLKKIAIFSLFFVLVYHTYFAIVGKNIPKLFDYFKPRFWTIIATMLFTAASICLLYLNGKCKKLFSYFAVVGKMALTNYITQDVISFFVFQGIGLRLYHSFPYYFYFFFAIGIYSLQVFFSRWWLKRHQYGPVEWLWRNLSKN
jgi:uncharacterized protein